MNAARTTKSDERDQSARLSRQITIWLFKKGDFLFKTQCEYNAFMINEIDTAGNITHYDYGRKAN
jgi:hypothetical protein